MDNYRDEGVIKYKCTLKLGNSPVVENYIDIEKWRSILFKLKFIGEYLPEKLGYGNLSKRIEGDEFVITGTQTGKLQKLSAEHYTLVTKCNLERMSVEAIGKIKPSSESLTHFAIYNEIPNLKYIFHIHDKELWNFMLNNDYEKTPSDVEYGTQEMAKAVKACIQGKSSGIFAMSGHEDGIIAYGQNASETGNQILNILKQSKK
jgi:ribulose-5-phosphate 4-epimerase/fuculose-1-phosphate aldolase